MTWSSRSCRGDVVVVALKTADFLFERAQPAEELLGQQAALRLNGPEGVGIHVAAHVSPPGR